MTIIYWIVGLLALTIVATFFIPTTSTTTKVINFDADINEVWSVYTDFASQPDWRDEIASISFSIENKAWVEKLKTGNVEIHIEVMEMITPTKLVFNTSSPNSFTGKYIAEFKATENGTVGTFTESAVTTTYIAKLIHFLFVNQEKLIDKYATDAMREIERRRNNS